MSTILITGGTGLIGQKLSVLLKAKGHKILILSRSKAPNTVYWNVGAGYLDEQAIEETDIVVHLAGANIGDKNWSSERKRIIVDSRVKTAELLFDKFNSRPRPLDAFISMSGIGFYGAQTTSQIFKEDDHPYNDFVGDVCKAWENAASPFAKMGARTSILRTGVVLSMDGGALKSIVRPIKWFVGAPLGSGKQWMPWVHIDDICNLILRAIEDSNMNGIYNAVASEHVTNGELTRKVAKVLHRPVWPFRVPGFVLKLLFGERSAIILEGSRVDNSRLIESGFKFEFPTVESALEDLLS